MLGKLLFGSFDLHLQQIDRRLDLHKFLIECIESILSNLDVMIALMGVLE